MVNQNSLTTLKRRKDLEFITLEAHPCLHKGFTQVEGLQVTSLLLECSLCFPPFLCSFASLRIWGFDLQNTKSLMSLSLHTKDAVWRWNGWLREKEIARFPSPRWPASLEKKRENVSPLFLKKTLNENKAIKLLLYFISCEWQTCN